MTTTTLRQLTDDELRDEKIIQDVIKGCDIGQVAHVYEVTLEHIQSLFQPPRFTSNTATIKALELARLDVATRALMPQVAVGDFDSIDRLLKIQARRSRYLGLDVPAQVESKSDIRVTISWASPDRLSYQHGEVIEEQAVEVAEDVEAVPVPAEPIAAPEPPAVAWKEPDPTSVAAAVAASKPKEPPAPLTPRPQPPAWRRKY